MCVIGNPFSSLLVKASAHRSSHVSFLLRDEPIAQDRKGSSICTQIFRRMAKDDTIMRRAFIAICHFRNVILPFSKGGCRGILIEGMRPVESSGGKGWSEYWGGIKVQGAKICSDSLPLTPDASPLASSLPYGSPLPTCGDDEKNFHARQWSSVNLQNKLMRIISSREPGAVPAMRGSATTTARHWAREMATFTRLRSRINASPRDPYSP